MWGQREVWVSWVSEYALGVQSCMQACVWDRDVLGLTTLWSIDVQKEKNSIMGEIMLQLNPSVWHVSWDCLHFRRLQDRAVVEVVLEPELIASLHLELAYSNGLLPPFLRSASGMRTGFLRLWLLRRCSKVHVMWMNCVLADGACNISLEALHHKTSIWVMDLARSVVLPMLLLDKPPTWVTRLIKTSHSDVDPSERIRRSNWDSDCYKAVTQSQYSTAIAIWSWIHMVKKIAPLEIRTRDLVRQNVTMDQCAAMWIQM